MTRQLLFLFALIITLGFFSFTAFRIYRFFKLTKQAFPIRDIGKRFGVMLEVAVGQTKIFRRPVIGLFHALVFWGFCVILFGSIEMIIDGLSGSERVLAFLGGFYNLIMASGDIFALIVAISIVIFLIRRIFMHIRRFEGIEMKKISHIDANIALSLILLLMISLLSMNASYVALVRENDLALKGVYPVGSLIAPLFAGFTGNGIHMLYEASWWSHILLIFLFANILPYSKHFHVFMSVPNVFLSRLDPLGKLPNMDTVTREVRMMLDPAAMASAPVNESTPARFGVKDAEDASWKNYLDSLSCTECGRCTSVCPANITGKKLSPRKVFMDLRARMKEKGPGLLSQGASFSDNKSLIRDLITEEELWACTTCNACAQECPININHPTFIVDMRRFLVMEEGSAPGGLKTMFSNIENNGAPWQYSPEDRLVWAENMELKVMSDLSARGEQPDYLLWVGCAGAFDDRYKKVVRSFVKILNHLGVSFAVLGKEESCTGDPARRAGNEMLYQMQALQNIQILDGYGVKRIITVCPHCFNIFKNEYPDLGGKYEVIHYLSFLNEMMDKGLLQVSPDETENTVITFHDPCYLGRGNGMYEEPRQILGKITGNLVEMERNKSYALCCGAGGGQMFKEAEKGTKEVFIERTEEALATNAGVIATACPFCMTMITDGIKYKNQEENVKNLDIAELIAKKLGL